MSSVREILDGLADGTVTIEQAEQDFATREWPVPAKAPLVNGLPDVTADPEPDPPDSFADVCYAHSTGQIDDDTYARLARAASQGKNVEVRY
jgi:hypothetical protein